MSLPVTSPPVTSARSCASRWRPSARRRGLYRELLALVEGRSVALEEYARQMIHAEELHLADVDKMLRKPGELRAFSPHAI